MNRMSLKLFNTLSRKKETFKPLHAKEIRLYTCGPTVYNYAHIGNLRTYIFEDILERTLLWDGYKVKRVMNITDVGHLTGDADEGEDKIEKEARAEKKTPLQIAAFYTKAFLRDLKSLNINIPKVLAPATKFVPEGIALIQQLVKKKYAYETSQAVYFDVRRFKNYGKLSRQSLAQKLVAARKEVVTDLEKRNPADFALWFKLTGKFKNHLMHWSSPWGEGFPGWHVECSAIARKFLGQPIDIHTGGVDHIGTHHTNEIAQSEAAYGKPLARYWLHGEFLIIDARRMGKSEGNFITVSDLEKKGFAPLAYRYLLLNVHYRGKLNFSWDSLAGAQAGLMALYDKYADLRKSARGKKYGITANMRAYLDAFTETLNDDLNTPKALVVLGRVLKDSLLSEGQKATLLERMDEVLGLDFKGSTKTKAKTPLIPTEVRELVRKREEARRSKQFIQADALRVEVDRLGYVVDDTPKGPVVRRK